jgi:DNA-binding LacI/PurR family transcriptional regulator
VLIRRRNPRSTIKDIARELQLSAATVSRILRGSDLFNEGTVKRVQRKARELNYRPNLIARALVKRGSSLIGLVLRDIGSSFFGDIITGVQIEVEEHGHSVILCNCSMDPAEERRHLKSMLDKCVEGVIITPISTEKTNVDVYNEVVAHEVPLVMVGNPRAGARAPYVKVDNILGGMLAARYLHGLGHRAFVYLTHKEAELHERKAFLTTENMERYQGFLQVVQRHGAEKRLFVVEAPGGEITEATIDRILSLRPRPTAVFAYSDLMAIHTLRMLERRGIVVPSDMSIVGFDDLEMAALVNPSLTTVAQPKREMGMIGAQKILALIAGKQVSPVVLQPELVVRDSSSERRSRRLRYG